MALQRGGREAAGDREPVCGARPQQRAPRRQRMPWPSSGDLWFKVWGQRVEQWKGGLPGWGGRADRGQRVSGSLMQAAWSCCVTFQVQWSGGGVITVLMIQAKQRGEGAGGHAGGGARSAVQESGKGRSEGPAGGREGRVGRGGGDVHVGDRPLAWGAPVPVGASSINHTPNE